MLQPAASNFGAAPARSSAGGAAVCQVMNPGPSGVVLRSLCNKTRLGQRIDGDCLHNAGGVVYASMIKGLNC